MILGDPNPPPLTKEERKRIDKAWQEVKGGADDREGSGPGDDRGRDMTIERFSELVDQMRTSAASGSTCRNERHGA